MQSGKNAMESVKESAANVAASAKSGMEKTKATLQEKAEKISTRDPIQKDMATEKKDERITRAELEKQEARAQNAAAKTGNAPAGGTATYSTTGATGHPTGAHQMSALPGHGAGQPAGQVVEGVAPAHPVSTATGTGHNPRAGGTAGQGYSTGGHYS